MAELRLRITLPGADSRPDRVPQACAVLSEEGEVLGELPIQAYQALHRSTPGPEDEPDLRAITLPVESVEDVIPDASE